MSNLFLNKCINCGKGRPMLAKLRGWDQFNMTWVCPSCLPLLRNSPDPGQTLNQWSAKQYAAFGKAMSEVIQDREKRGEQVSAETKARVERLGGGGSSGAGSTSGILVCPKCGTKFDRAGVERMAKNQLPVVGAVTTVSVSCSVCGEVMRINMG